MSPPRTPQDVPAWMISIEKRLDRLEREKAERQEKEKRASSKDIQLWEDHEVTGKTNIDDLQDAGRFWRERAIEIEISLKEERKRQDNHQKALIGSIVLLVTLIGTIVAAILKK